MDLQAEEKNKSKEATELGVSGYSQWYAGKYLTTGSLGKPCFLVFVDFHGVTTPIIANCKLSVPRSMELRRDEQSALARSDK